MTDPIDTDAVRAKYTGGDPREFDFCEFRSATLALCAEIDTARAREAKVRELCDTCMTLEWWSVDDLAAEIIRALDETP